MSKPTIIVPRGDYIQRYDDEGRDFHPYCTVHAAAERWLAAADDRRTFHSVNVDDPDEGPVQFAWVDDDGIHLAMANPDDDRLYPAADLPFTIKQSPFDVGDVVRPESAPNERYTVAEIHRNGTVGLHGSDPYWRPSTLTLVHTREQAAKHDETAAASTGPEPETTPEPRVFVVTVPAHYSATLNILDRWGKDVSRITVREAR